MNEQLASILRTILKIGAGILVTKGVIDAGQADQAAIGVEALVGAAMGLWGIFWSAKSAKTKVELKKEVEVLSNSPGA